ncbi:hypothetical protein [Acinetobacter equi]|uniref:hypothetical protein n=1 Tax=Acinetobacter equi TaxID=1324350 RepID=UPI000B15DC12|nr:hypothetical protein [Acinetobacter equi]
MKKIELGDHVVLATIENITFKIVAENTDGSYEIEAKISDDQILRYGNISKEMLRILD